MAKKILILETSDTIQNLFTTTLDAKKYSLRFEKETEKVFSALADFKPELFLLNCDIDNPKSFELVKILRSLQENFLPAFEIAMYSNMPSALDENFAKDAGADCFIKLSPETLLEELEKFEKASGAEKTEKTEKTEKSEVAGESKNTEEKAPSKKQKALDSSVLFNKTALLLNKSSYKNVMLTEISGLVGKIESLEEMIKSYLLLLAQICEVPLAAMYLLENDGPHGYYVCAEKLSRKDISDFLKVCEADFEKNLNNGMSVNVKPKQIESNGALENFYSSEVKLSSYEYRKLGNVPASVHIVSQGNIISEKIDYFDFSIKHAAEVFDKALIVEKKIFFEKRIRRAFSRFVPEQIIDSLVMQADDTEQKVAVGETRSVAILFSDIRSFTNISEKNRADVLVAFLNRYFSTMVEIIKKHGGTIDKFIGDAIMAEFGTPVSYDDNCRRAVMAAYEMRDALSTIELGDLVMPEGMVFNIGIGIHYGEVIVGSIGSKDKTDYSVIGDNVNLASRLEGLTKTYGTQILVSETVKADAGENSFCFRHLDDVRVKGKKNAVPIYAVDRSENEFSAEYKDSYIKGMELYKQGIWNLAKDYFLKALDAAQGDKAAKLMLERCEEFIKNPPENWDGAIAFMTK